MISCAHCQAGVVAALLPLLLSAEPHRERVLLKTQRTQVAPGVNRVTRLTKTWFDLLRTSGWSIMDCELTLAVSDSGPNAPDHRRPDEEARFVLGVEGLSWMVSLLPRLSGRRFHLASAGRGRPIRLRESAIYAVSLLP